MVSFVYFIFIFFSITVATLRANRYHFTITVLQLSLFPDRIQRQSWNLEFIQVKNLDCFCKKPDQIWGLQVLLGVISLLLYIWDTTTCFSFFYYGLVTLMKCVCMCARAFKSLTPDNFLDPAVFLDRFQSGLTLALCLRGVGTRTLSPSL